MGYEVTGSATAYRAGDLEFSSTPHRRKCHWYQGNYSFLVQLFLADRDHNCAKTVFKSLGVGLGSNSVRGDASGDCIGSDAAKLLSDSNVLGSQTCHGYSHPEDVWPFQDSGDDGGWRMSDAASRRLHFRVGRLAFKILTNRCQLNGEWQTAA